MITKIKIFILLTTILLGMNSAIAVENLALNPVEMMYQSQPAIGARGMVFVENIDAGSTIGMIKYSHTPTFASDGTIKAEDYWDWNSCSSWVDSTCPIKSGFTLEGKVVLGSCLSEAEIGCIQTFSVIGENGASRSIKLIGPAFANVIDIPESSVLGIPRSSSPQVYSDESGRLYLVRAGIRIHIGDSMSPTMKLDVDINPVVKEANLSLTTPVIRRTVDSRTKVGVVNIDPSPLNCLATDVGICYKALQNSIKVKYGIQIRVPNTVSGWLRGRVSEPSFSSKVLNENSQLISVDAFPAKMPIAGGWVKYAELPLNFIDKLYPSGGSDKNPDASYLLVSNPSQGERGVEEYLAWSPFFKDKAITTVSTWSFGTNNSGGDEPCLKTRGAITGFVASNASVYSSNPPAWDSGSSTLSYKVAAPHLDENGADNVGTYTLAMPLATIKCLYKQSALPPSATISIGYGAEVVNIATITLKSNADWVYFNASGFHYSNPTIKVKFAKSASQSAAKPPSQNSSSQSAAPLSQTAPGIKTQWCAKGNAKKKVVAAKPVCPKGYKKIADPLVR